MAVCCSVLQTAHTAPHCNTLQHTATRCNILKHTTTHCNTQQHAATHCTILQHTATHCDTLHQQYTLEFDDTSTTLSDQTFRKMSQNSELYIEIYCNMTMRTFNFCVCVLPYVALILLFFNLNDCIVFLSFFLSLTVRGTDFTVFLLCFTACGANLTAYSFYCVLLYRTLILLYLTCAASCRVLLRCRGNDPLAVLQGAADSMCAGPAKANWHIIAEN